MNWTPAMEDLKNALSEIYSEVVDCRRVAETAGLRPQNINFEGKIINVWHNILKEAQIRGKIQTVIDIALKQYEDHEELVRVQQIYFQEIAERAIILPGPPGGSMPAQADDYTREGEEICINRRFEVVTFREMLKRDRLIPQHILVFQVPAEKGKTKLTKRFEHLCKQDAERGEKILYARVEFRDTSLSPYSLIAKLINTIVLNTKNRFQNHLGPIEELRKTMATSESNRPSNERGRSSETEFENLAFNFGNCLQKMSNEWIVVLILDGFEHSKETGRWYLKDCLPYCVGIDNVIMVLAGRSGLSGLASSEEVMYRDTLAPMQNWDDCQRMAELHYELRIGKEQAEDLIEKFHGDLANIDKMLWAIKNLKNLPHLVPGLVPNGGTRDEHK